MSETISQNGVNLLAGTDCESSLVLDCDSVTLKEISVDEEFPDPLNGDEEFVDFVRLEGDSFLIDGVSNVDVESLLLDTSLCNRPAPNEKPTSNVAKAVGGGWKNGTHNVAPGTESESAGGLKCHICLFRFKIKAHLTRHMLLEHKRETSPDRVEKIYSRCRRCNQIFPTTLLLQIHLREIHKSTLPCDICLRLFDSQESLARHRKFHVGDNPFACDVCNKQCKNSSHLHFHRRTHFTAEFGYRCQYCDRRFSSNGNCRKHIASIHTNEKRYKCTSCPEAFIYPKQLKVHLAEKHNPQNFSCADCNQPFQTSKDLKEHRAKVHYSKDRPHACDQCPSRFKQRGHLKTHLLTHSGERPFGCNRCEKRFLTGHDLKVHQRARHSTDRPFRCSLCGQSFLVQYLLNQHRKKVHIEDSD
ncbi:zinc finger protein 771-like [Uranotaenia lowii]|uniref:zinc finger protein 771-like n=1 Tax=Uranotaenia lowii TaxID=190385 RepID=UPI00247A0749|nr:zinc finger protein 771-like [Uranotaenia lowii]